MKTLRPIPTFHFAAYIGLDWSDGKHDLCLQDADSGVREPAQIEHSPEAIDEWARGLRTRFGGRPSSSSLKQMQKPLSAVDGAPQGVC